MGKILIQLLASIIITIAIVLIYNAREIANKHFSADEQYSSIKTLKVLGVIIAWIGMGILYVSIV